MNNPDQYNLNDLDMGFGKESEIADSVKNIEMRNLAGRYEKSENLKGLRYGIIEVTLRCQLECPGCYMVRRKALNKGDMSLEDAVKILDLCRDYRGGEELETMDILGGEPLLWPELKSFIEILIKRKIKPWIFTNMLAITPELAEWLRQREVFITGKLNINPDDESQIPIQAKMIGRDERFAKRMFKALTTFTEAGYNAPMFRVQNLLRRGNIPFAGDYYRWCMENNIGTDLEVMGSGEEINADYWGIAPSPEQLAEMINIIQQIREEFGLPPAEVLMPHIFGSCPFFDKGLYFAVDGTIRACSNSTAVLGKISDKDSIKKAYESQLLCNRRSLTKENIGQPCCSCGKFEKCRGGCRATAEGLGNSFGGYPLCPVPVLERIS